MSGRLDPDADSIGVFVNALFRYADDGSFVSLRAFDQHDDGKPPVLIRPVQINGAGCSEVIETAVRCERDLANRAQASVFCPPIATFTVPDKAAEATLANGLAISVELDQGNTAEARQKLEGLLGAATVVVASGGTWKDPQTGALSPKLHLHWRLSEPTREPIDHATLKRARHLACLLVGADPTAKSIVHPLRWPGTWHRKAEPKLTRIIALNEAAQVHLPDALDALETAVELAGISEFGTGGPKQSGEPQAPIPLLESAVSAIPNTDAEWDEWNTAGLLLYRATCASDDGLRIWTAWSRKSPKHRDHACEERWAHFATSPPTRGGAGTIFMRASAHGWKRPEQPKSGAETAEPWPSPFDFLAEDDITGAPELRPEHLPEAISPFVFDTADRMGADPAAVALASLVALASVMSDDWRIQPKRFDTEWTEAPRIWGAIVGDPSVRKTPILRACTSPIDRLEAEARSRHAEAMAAYRIAHKAWKKDKDADSAAEPKPPILTRYMVESTTIEALSEVLRDDAEARQAAPARKVLVRQDELAELLANFDRYREGGNGAGDRGAFLRLYNGGRFTVDRILRGSFASSNWSACLLGGIQPAPIQRIASHAVDDGLLQRFCYCVVSGQGQEDDRAPNTAAIQRYRALFPALGALRPGRTPDRDAIQQVAFDADAHRHRLEVLGLAEAVALMPDASPRLKSALGKWPGLFPRLALIFHLIEIADARAAGRDPPSLLVVTEATASRAAAYMRDILLPHLLRADAMMFGTVQTGHARWIAGYILAKALSVLTLRDVVQDYRPLRGPEQHKELLAVLTGLEAFGWLRPLPAPATSPHPTRWAVNPAVHTDFAARAKSERSTRKEQHDRIADRIAKWKSAR